MNTNKKKIGQMLPPNTRAHEIRSIRGISGLLVAITQIVNERLTIPSTIKPVLKGSQG